MGNRKHWFWFAFTIIASFAVLGYYGAEIYRTAPPIPEKVFDSKGNVLMTAQQIKDGQNVWQSIGGQEIGSVWGHGAYQAPDWTADYLHRQSIIILDGWAKAENGKTYEAQDDETKAKLEARLKKMIRENRYDNTSKTLTVSNERAESFHALEKYYTALFMGDPSLKGLRESYAMAEHTVKDAGRMKDMNAFFFWATWVTSTDRPGDNITYTNNWPSEKLIDNKPTASIVLWSVFSVVLMIAGIIYLSFFYAKNEEEELSPEEMPNEDPMRGLKATPSMKAVLKYIWVVCALFLLQMGMGILTAHYGVEGQALFGFPLAEYLPYTVTRSWHLQLAIFWIATSWLATGLFIAPSVAGFEPKYQKLGVNVLFVALVILVFGSMTGQWYAIMQKLGLVENFWFGHQGYEYVELGRFWQLILLVGLLIWLALMGRCLIPAIKTQKESRSLLILFLISSIAIALFYASGLMWDRQTHLAIAEYWRWWVVHLWVEGFFEVFATVVIAFLFVRMGLLRMRSATKASIASATIFLFGGIIGTFHHLYFSGTPTAVLALGSAFSALEIVPLSLIGYEAYHHYKLTKEKPWLKAYKWPIYYFIAVAFWNGVGAGVFGFLINPPIALYYMQGLNTTPVHGHTALFGVYGMLGIGLMLFVLRAMRADAQWNEKLMKWGFWGLNIGLGAMMIISVLPVGIAQAYVSITDGMWYARSAEFLQQDIFEAIRWSRVIGDVLFAGGAGTLIFFIFKLSKEKLIGQKSESSVSEKVEEHA
ncbi:nitric-oxide reductase large subunit (plasmid) [Fulvitalea axinellae]|uniref:Nitric-oxide reductase large subunit n=1 Tax=Fulvitalea axinellae TaxID=1182444 RepID=A0AAU9D531_9BACT|nr:nitric-oxide reductase large subunit [Fulvitalea axinellae]